MAQPPPDTAQRDANLDDLKKKVKEWVGKEKDRLKKENEFMQSWQRSTRSTIFWLDDVPW